MRQGERLKSFARPAGQAIDEIVVHESVSASVESTLTTLRSKGYGVHLIVSPTGEVTQHAPLVDECAHAGVADTHPPSTHNDRSVAVELVSPYYEPEQLEPGQVVIDARWAHRGRYLMPSLPALEAVWRAIQWVREQVPTIPLAFPSVDAQGRYRWGRDPRHNVGGGVRAHAAWNHSDGHVPTFYILLRSLGFEADDAYAETIRVASSVPGSRLTPVPSPQKGAA